jgi:hypothetical protein
MGTWTKAAIQSMDGNNQIVNNTFEPSGDTKKVTSAGASVQSSVYGSNVLVRIVADAACHYKISTNPTATTSDVYLPANSGEQIRIQAGNKIAVLAASVNLYVTELV